MPVMIGVDPHKASHTAAVLGEHGRLLDQQRFPATLAGYQRLLEWAGSWPRRCWAFEGAHGVGRALAQQLVADGEQVLDVPAKLAARVRVLSAGHGRKTDPDDAVSVALAAQGARRLRRVGVEGDAVVLRLLTNRREDLVAMRTQTINRLHRLLVDLVPTRAGRNLTAKSAAALLRKASPSGAAASTRHQLAADLIGDVVDLDRGSQECRRVSRPRSPGPRPAWSSSLGSGRCWLPSSLVMSATCVASRLSITSPPIPAQPHWRPPAAESFAIGCHEPVTASSTMRCT
jgi:transposase